jgi:hypothetical protein
LQANSPNEAVKKKKENKKLAIEFVYFLETVATNMKIILLLDLQTKDLTGWIATRVSPPPPPSVIAGSTSILNIFLFCG